MGSNFHRALPLLGLVSLVAGGCLALKADQDEIAREVAKLRKEVLAQGEAAERNDSLADELEAKLEEVEDLLRRNQADLGLRVENLELDAQELRGEADNAEYRASAVRQELQELRADIDQRLGTLEEKLNEATSIPENKKDLLVEADKYLAKRDYKKARRLLHTYESRYPGDSKMPEVRFKIGLTYFSEREYKSALGQFYRIIQDSPDAQSIPDALYYSGLSFAKLGQCSNAIAYFEALQEKKTKAPEQYKRKAAEQVAILKKDKGKLCIDDPSATEKAKIKKTRSRRRKS